ncbi:MAG: hypothetical protein NC243_13725 [Lachnoclostridium sp.]|nr:hypothetical protein [Lachnoclostridium sp.]
MDKTVENMADIREDKGMGIGIGANYSGRTVYTIKNADGTTAATFSVTKRTSKSKQKQKKKKLQYNFKQLSNQILASKTSRGARRVAAKARGMIASLVSKLKMGEYDDQEIANAIIHARKMERIARKKMRHMQEEEMAKTGGSCLEELEERESEDKFDGMEEVAIITEDGQEQTISREEWQALMKEVEELMASLMEESMEEFSEAMELSDLSEEVMGAAPREMDPEDLKSLKRKHRAKELQEITEADMKYLQALFQKLEQEKREVSNGSSSSFDGVSLELGGVEMPVQTVVPVMVEGANMDTSV